MSAFHPYRPQSTHSDIRRPRCFGGLATTRPGGAANWRDFIPGTFEERAPSNLPARPSAAEKDPDMIFKSFIALALVASTAPATAASGPTDPQIAHIAYTAGNIDIAAARQALARSHNKTVRSFAREMVRDHQAVNNKALALVKKLHVTPEANATSSALSRDATATRARLSRLRGHAFDRAYLANEVSYHKTVNSALKSTLIPSAKNEQLKSLLETGLTLFREHQAHAEHLAGAVK